MSSCNCSLGRHLWPAGFFGRANLAGEWWAFAKGIAGCDKLLFSSLQQSNHLPNSFSTTIPLGTGETVPVFLGFPAEHHKQ